MGFEILIANMVKKQEHKMSKGSGIKDWTSAMEKTADC